MNIVITGAGGFLGKNLSFALREEGFTSLWEANRETSDDELAEALLGADFVFHLAGSNRPDNESDFKITNVEYTAKVLANLKSCGRPVPLVFSSSTQAVSGSLYGKSKLAAEELIFEYQKSTGAAVFVYRLPNIFGKWSRPNYNSFISTFCSQIINDEEISIHDESARVNLVYVDDVCRDFVGLIEGPFDIGFREVRPCYETTVGAVAIILKSFRESQSNLIVGKVGGGLERALYATYLSYMSPSQFSYGVPVFSDRRGSFCEVIKTEDSGQVSFFTAHPGVTRGGHYHHTKNEKFLVLKGEALFKFKNISSGECSELEVNGSSPTIVQTVPGWAHDITNVGQEELVVMLWANELFDRDRPDTVFHAL